VVSKLLRPFQQLRRLSYAGRDLSRLILCHETSCRASSRLIFKIDVSHAEIAGVADDVGNAAIFPDCPRWGSGARSCPYVATRVSADEKNTKTPKALAIRYSGRGATARVSVKGSVDTR
jgi:hypothetical protein